MVNAIRLIFGFHEPKTWILQKLRADQQRKYCAVKVSWKLLRQWKSRDLPAYNSYNS